MMKKTMWTRAAIVGVAGMLSVSMACANGYREKNMQVEVAKSAMKVTPVRDWNSLSIRPGKKAETWTLDGEQLNDVTFYGGIAPGEPLIRETSKKHKPLPKFSSETLLVEIPELLEGTYRTEKGIGSFSVTNSKPDRFLGQDGIRFTYEYVDADNLPRKGEARAALIKGQLYMATFDAPRLHYFEATLDDFHALTDSAAL
ncbi:hypothetical protein N6H05_02405 [Sphingobium sp. WTD-1]|uniref:hypothetical protein n=1 Tax=Sphingobium sp. WTD-1 TaxID=2979467 RepID=UPI0024DE67AA|nr:hypothetical protein [Sphingobium sp. WTD-1]WIA56694.1 hypothetical protein N6H05_02405 [Sphingobium sp. WTD-1]